MNGQHPSQVKFVLVDAKKVEFDIYRHIENHFLAKLAGEEAILIGERQVLHTLNALCIEMDNRYELLKEAGVRNIQEYNDKFCKRQLNPRKGNQFLPFIVLVIDDLGTMSYGILELYKPLERLVLNGYRVGMLNVICTSQFVGEMASLLSRIIGQKVIFRLHNREDYRRFLDTVKVDRFLQKGGFLYNAEGRVHKGRTSAFSFDSMKKIVDAIAGQRGYPQAFLMPEYVDEKELEGKSFDSSEKDPLFEDAAKLIVQNQIGSTSLLQRRMKLGYNRVGRLMDQLEAAGVVGPNLGSKAREVLIPNGYQGGFIIQLKVQRDWM
jgi:S-DNA-T family DNA segregation ATPase FtsK/SpoIIIE